MIAEGEVIEQEETREGVDMYGTNADVLRC
jgi:hypothetical protein